MLTQALRRPLEKAIQGWLEINPKYLTGAHLILFFLFSDAFDCVFSQRRRLAVFFITFRLIKLSPLTQKKAQPFHALLVL